MNILAKIGIALLVLIAVAAVAFYFAWSSPRDLGIRFGQADLNSANAKLGVSYGVLPSSADPKASLKLTGSKPVAATFSSEELTALMASHASAWAFYPVSNAQVKINKDGTVEIAGVLDTDRLDGYAKSTNMPPQYYDFLKNNAAQVPVKPAFYAKGTMSVVNGKVSGNAQQVKIGAVDVPQQMVSDNYNLITGFAENRIKEAGVTVQSATFEDGKLNFKGTVPEQAQLAK